MLSSIQQLLFLLGFQALLVLLCKLIWPAAPHTWKEGRNLCTVIAATEIRLGNKQTQPLLGFETQTTSERSWNPPQIHDS